MVADNTAVGNFPEKIRLLLRQMDGGSKKNFITDALRFVRPLIAIRKFLGLNLATWQ